MSAEPELDRTPTPLVEERPSGDPAVPRLELSDWAERYGLVAGVTTRPLSLGLWSDEAVGQVSGRWRAFRAAFAPRFPTVVFSHQVHGSQVRWHDDLPSGWLILDGVDGHATAQSGVLLTVTIADCVPVYLALPGKKGGAIALLHAGWRGAAAGIVGRGIEMLLQRTEATAADTVMHCGVGICGNCYEVGPEVAARFGMSGTVQLDIRAQLAQQARDLGVQQISTSPWCTAEAQEHFFSHRASGGRDGRMVAYLGRPLG